MMEGYLRVALLVMGAIVVIFILIEAWYSKRRKLKLSNLSADYSSPLTLDSEEILDLDLREHRINALHHEPFEDVHDLVLISAPETVERSGLKVAVMDQAEAAPTRPVVVNMPQTKTVTPDFTNDLIVLSVVAQPGQQFVSYDLMQAISGAGLQFGEMNIFHYYFSTPQGKKPLFSLASATEPGEFNMDRIGEISCTGLTLFMLLATVPNPQLAFDQMMKSAEQLADDLGGDLRAGPRKPLTPEVYDQYIQKVLHYQLKKRA